MKQALAAALLILAGAGVACGKKAGGPCQGNESTCLDTTTALACRGGSFSAVPCAGPLACAKFQDRANCDTSVASAADPCMAEEGFACSADKKRAVVCHGGRFEPYLDCRGQNGCSMLGQTLSCDTSVAEKGDRCKTQGAVSCTPDQKRMVICRDGQFDLYRYCRGQYGCFIKGEGPSCDETVSQPGDPCGLPGQVVCSTDGKTELVCQGIFMKSLTCKTSCVVSNRPGRPIDCN